MRYFASGNKLFPPSFTEMGPSAGYIALGDGQGVALAAIQALYKVAQEKDQQIQQLQQRLERLEQVAQK